jgi:hypothetical protein
MSQRGKRRQGFGYFHSIASRPSESECTIEPESEMSEAMFINVVRAGLTEINCFVGLIALS